LIAGFADLGLFSPVLAERPRSFLPSYLFRDLRRRMATQKNPKSIAGRASSCTISAADFRFDVEVR
jgi:hypothetical protein